jgi:hypothetical protein
VLVGAVPQPASRADRHRLKTWRRVNISSLYIQKWLLVQ